MPSVMDLALYLTTAVSLFAQVLWLMAWTLWGAPTRTARTVVLFGCGVLLAAAVMLKWKARLAAGVALCACVVIWLCYAPAVMYTALRLPSIHKPRVFLPAFIVCTIPVILLALSTVRSAFGVLRLNVPKG